jgi:hypothetical protein
VPAAWLSKVHHEALCIFGDDTFRRDFWEEVQKLRGVALPTSRLYSSRASRATSASGDGATYGGG